ncbi:MAG: hypothetical protein QME60_00555 [Verrucomicrobiota bacterium]|nr:hypothetical protein [Verrucomicrobiota bacterium]
MGKWTRPLARAKPRFDGEEFETKTVHVEVMARHLSGIGPRNFTLEKGMTIDEFSALTDILSKPRHKSGAEGDFTDMITRQGFGHITSRRIILREVAEDEAVISKKEFKPAMLVPDEAIRKSLYTI